MKTSAEMYQLYVEAEEKVLSGQSYSINGRSLTRANLSEIVENREKWARKMRAESNGGCSYALASFDR